MTKDKRYIFVIGVFSIAFALLGFGTIAHNAFVALPNYPEDSPYLNHVFYSVSALAGACYALLLLSGIQFIRLRTGFVRLFAGTMVVQVVAAFVAGLLFASQTTAAYAGIATGAVAGIGFQLIILFPLS